MISARASTRVAVTVSTRQSAKAANRSVGSKCRFLTTKTPQKPASPAPSPIGTPGNPVWNKAPLGGFDMANPPDVVLEVTPEMRRNNVALAIVLFGFVGGIFYYSLISVGQQDMDGVDPLAQLKLEAQEARDKEKKEHTPDGRAQQLLEEFTRGDHDPDKAEVDALEELELMEEEDSKKKKKAWYKFW